MTVIWKPGDVLPDGHVVQAWMLEDGPVAHQGRPDINWLYINLHVRTHNIKHNVAEQIRKVFRSRSAPGRFVTTPPKKNVHI